MKFLFVSALAAALLVAGAASLSAQPASRAPRNAEEFDALFQQVKNWGRWGPNDQLGSANLVTVAKRKQAVALVKDGITVNAVAPSLIATDMVSAVASSAARIPLGRFGTPQECAQVVMMLVGNEYMTGQTVALSGGLSFV